MWKFFASAVPMSLGDVDNVRRRVPAICKSHIVENEKFGFRSEKCGICNAGTHQISFGFFGEATRVAIVRFACDWIDNRADERKSWFGVENVDPRRRGIRDHEHVGALMTFQPRMLEPSKPSPSVKISSLCSLSVVVKCCHVPGRSVNLKSTSFTSLSLIILLTSDGVLSLAIILIEG